LWWFPYEIIIPQKIGFVKEKMKKNAYFSATDYNELRRNAANPEKSRFAAVLMRIQSKCLIKAANAYAISIHAAKSAAITLNIIRACHDKYLFIC